MTGWPGMVRASRTTRLPVILSAALTTGASSSAPMSSRVSTSPAATVLERISRCPTLSSALHIREHGIQNVQRRIGFTPGDHERRHDPDHVLTGPEYQQAFAKAALNDVVPFLDCHFFCLTIP